MSYYTVPQPIVIPFGMDSCYRQQQHVPTTIHRKSDESPKKHLRDRFHTLNEEAHTETPTATCPPGFQYDTDPIRESIVLLESFVFTQKTGTFHVLSGQNPKIYRRSLYMTICKRNV